MSSRPVLHYADGALGAATAMLLLLGVVLLWRAVSFEGYIIALLVVAVSALCFEGRRELLNRQARPGRHADALASPDIEH